MGSYAVVSVMSATLSAIALAPLMPSAIVDEYRAAEYESSGVFEARNKPDPKPQKYSESLSDEFYFDDLDNFFEDGPIAEIRRDTASGGTDAVREIRRGSQEAEKPEPFWQRSRKPKSKSYQRLLKEDLGTPKK